jgi:uncharacterized protein YqhQ
MSCDKKKLNVGGQAVIEGVMMRSPNYWAVAVRKPDGEIEIKEDKLKLLSETNKFAKLPVIRGVIMLLSALVLGIKALNFSANVAYDEDEEMSDWAIYATMAIAFAIAIAFFFILPLFLTKLMNFKSYVMFNIVDGIIRIFFFLAYVYLISFMKDIRRIFEYHGAEHKVIYNYEENEELSVESAKKYSTLHPRCGTSFLIIVLVISILLFSLVPKASPFYVKVLSRIFFIPLIAGISYEMLKLSAKHQNNFLVKLFILPGLWLQKVTTKEPDEKQVEVALEALKTVLNLEKGDVNASKA